MSLDCGGTWDNNRKNSNNNLQELKGDVLSLEGMLDKAG